MRVSEELGVRDVKWDMRESLLRGLRVCQVPYSANACERCPRKMDWYDCVNKLMRDAADMIEDLSAEGLWVYCPDDEGRPRWKCSRCGKIVHKDPADKLYCAACGQRNRKEA